MAERPAAPRIYVLAGTNGAGKSSIGGAMLIERGTEYFNPDEAARRFRSADPSLTQAEANSSAWHAGKALLERAIAERLSFAFETTLGGSSMAALLETAASQGIEVRIWYVGLSSPEHHLARVRERVARGGHDIPEADVRRRYDQSRLNLIRLLPRLTELRLYDNSTDADPGAGHPPRPVLLLHLDRGQAVAVSDLATMPAWARPIVAAAAKLGRAKAPG